jgi:hypothetical protein
VKFILELWYDFKHKLFGMSWIFSAVAHNLQHMLCMYSTVSCFVKICPINCVHELHGNNCNHLAIDTAM